MPDDVTELAQLQAWMLGTVTGSGEGSPDLAHHVRHSSRLSPSAGLAVYRDAYARRVVSFMETMHPAVHHALGAERFEATMVDYFHHHPPRGHGMSALDEHLAGYLSAAGSQPGGDAPQGVAVEFVVDLARLERLFHLVFEGPGPELDQPVEVPDQGSGPYRPWLDTILEPAPSVRLLASRFPVSAYRAAVRQGGHPDPPSPADTYLVLSRRHFVVTITELDADRYALLQALVAGVPLRIALSLAPPTRPETAGGWVESWIDDGLLRPARPRPA